ncbi:MAG: hypothetical protein ACI4W2_07705 [Eubacterium sp.]
MRITFTDCMMIFLLILLIAAIGAAVTGYRKGSRPLTVLPLVFFAVICLITYFVRYSFMASLITVVSVLLIIAITVTIIGHKKGSRLMTVLPLICFIAICAAIYFAGAYSIESM